MELELRIELKSSKKMLFEKHGIGWIGSMKVFSNSVWNDFSKSLSRDKIFLWTLSP